MNTYIEYLYRDEENNKVWKSIVLPGQMTLEQIEPYLDDGKYFIPHQVGLEDLQGKFQHGAGPRSDIDHPWHEMNRIEPTEALPTVEMTAEELLVRFSEVEWNENAALVKLGLVEEIGGNLDEGDYLRYFDDEGTVLWPEDHNGAMAAAFPHEGGSLVIRFNADDFPAVEVAFFTGSTDQLRQELQESYAGWCVRSNRLGLEVEDGKVVDLEAKRFTEEAQSDD